MSSIRNSGSPSPPVRIGIAACAIESSEQQPSVMHDRRKAQLDSFVALHGAHRSRGKPASPIFWEPGSPFMTPEKGVQSCCFVVSF